MDVLGKELSQRFDSLYSLVLGNIHKSVRFEPLSSQNHISTENLRGARQTDPLHPDTMVVYLDTHLSNKQFELTAAHELFHELVRSKGIGIEFRIRGIPKDKLPEAMQEAARITNCFTHIAVNLCMKEHGYDIADYDNPSLTNLKKLIRKQQTIDESAVPLHAVEYISHVYRAKYSCPSIDISGMAMLYGKLQPKIINLARRLMSRLPDVDLTTAIGCYEATKALRDALGNELGIELGTIIQFKSPRTGQPE